ncbi:MAG TPA: chorismate synthase [Bdellovibrionales bacterium]|nr:MAG: chorismate synthase [Bdellovibrionales bacterium GWB1_52_6]OFZ04741.1 MAG: chorismate synthase [Bdellovibrionales bacterium GWA1_52_35]OFZ35658.1 MAG: chorismate synthase [Bdellovibrionales bacterium GWC1_52_8]HAR42026.1 chorismate synthase [Bdellovibrionales bacterium]HCM39554.1 chorismate synthase [Bdellovibrionales bacterium]
MSRLRFLTAGESHGKWLVGILEGVPAGLPVSLETIQDELQRRKQGHGRGARQKIETDEFEIASGVRQGFTLGSPISVLIANRDWKTWQEALSVAPLPSAEIERCRVAIPRPGHADFAGALKYGHADMRNVLERASARETAMRVAVGSIARLFLAEAGITVASRVIRIGAVESPDAVSSPETWRKIADASPVRCLDSDASARMVQAIDEAQKQGDTLGGIFEVAASGLPIGLGSHVHWDRRIEGPIAQAFMSLNAIKGVEIGGGFSLAAVPGSQAQDELLPGDESRGRSWNASYRTNHSGGIVGGITTGQLLSVRAAMKPIATLMRPLNSIDPRTGLPAHAHVERADVCAVPAAAVIGESLLALVLAEAVLEKFGGDSMNEILPRILAWKDRQHLA